MTTGNDDERKPSVTDSSPLSNDWADVLKNAVEPMEQQNRQLAVPMDDVMAMVSKAETPDELTALEQQFVLNLSKKEMARVAKQDELLDAVIAQAEKRIKERPGELTTKDILDYMSVMQANVDKAMKPKKAPEDETAPRVSITNIKNDVTVNTDGDPYVLNRESRARVLDAVKAILGQTSLGKVEAAQDAETNDTEQDGQEEPND